MNKQNEIDEKIQNLQNELDALKKLREEEKFAKKWEPSRGNFIVDDVGVMDYSLSLNDTVLDRHRMSGSACNNRQQGKQLSKARKTFQWMCQLAFELNPSGKLGGGYEVFFRGQRFGFNRWSQTKTWGSIFETREAAKKAAEIMNNDPENWKFYQ